MDFGFTRGLGNFYRAYDQGVQNNINRTNAAEDRDYLREQRELKRDQQQRALDEQARADRLREELSTIPPAGSLVDPDPPAAPQKMLVGGPADPIGAPTTGDAQSSPIVGAQVQPAQRVVTQDQELREIAAAYRRQGDIGKALALGAKADSIAMTRSAQMFQRVRAGAKGKSALDIANEVSGLYNADPLPGQIVGVEDLGDGAARVSIRNRDTGQVQSQDFKSPEEILTALEGYYSPATLAAYQKAQRDALIKVQEEQAKGAAKRTSLNPGQELVDGSGRVLHTNTNTPRGYEIIGANPDGTPIYGRTSSRGSGSSGPSRSEKAADPMAAVTDALKFIASNSAFKDVASPTQVARAQTIARQVITESHVDPAVAAEVAVDAALNPDKIQPTFDPKTGTINATFNFQGGNFTIERLGTPGNARGVTPDQLKSITAQFLTGRDDTYRSLFIPASVSAEARVKLGQTIESTLRSPDSIKAIEQRLGRAPTEAELDAAVQDGIAKAGQQLDLIRLYGDPAIKAKYLKASGFAADDSKPAASGVAGGAAPPAELGAGAPADIAARYRERIAARQASAEKESAANEEAAAEEAADKAKRAEEVKWLTVDAARVLKPSEALMYYRRYADVLPSDVVRQLRRQQ